MAEHSPEILAFSFSSDLINNNSSVSIIPEWPTLHPIQTTHLFPVLICKLFRDYFFKKFSFHLSPPHPFLFSLSQAVSRPSRKPGQQFVPAPWGLPGPKLSPILFFLFASVTNKHSHFITQTHRRVRLHTETGFSIIFFPICGFFFSFLQKMQTKEKQGFQLKVHLFFNMKTLIELVGSPCSSGQQSPLATDRRHLETQELGFIWRSFPTRVMSKGKWMWGRTLREEHKRRKEKNIIGEGEVGTAEACFSSLHLLPFFPKTGNSSPPWIGTEFTLVPNAYGFGFTSVKHHLPIFIITCLVSHGIYMLLLQRNNDFPWAMGPVHSSQMESCFPAKKLIFLANSTVVNLWFPFDPGPFPSSPPLWMQVFSCHYRWWLTHLDPHWMDAAQNLLLMACQGDPYSQEVSGRAKKSSMLELGAAFSQLQLITKGVFLKIEWPEKCANHPRILSEISPSI